MHTVKITMFMICLLEYIQKLYIQEEVHRQQMVQGQVKSLNYDVDIIIKMIKTYNSFIMKL